MCVNALQMIMMRWKKDELESPKENQSKHQPIIFFIKSNHKKSYSISILAKLFILFSRCTKIINKTTGFSQICRLKNRFHVF